MEQKYTEWDKVILSRTETIHPHDLQLNEDMETLQLDSIPSRKKTYFTTCLCPFCEKFLFKIDDVIYCNTTNCFKLELAGLQFTQLELALNLFCLRLNTHRSQCSAAEMFGSDGKQLLMKCNQCGCSISITNDSVENCYSK